MIDETIQELQSGIEKAHEALKKELSRLRTGRASPDVLDSLRVDYYGTPTPISQMASVTVPEPRLLIVKPWDKSTIALIEKAIMTSNVGLNPQNDGEIIRLPVPPLTEERRREIVKQAKEAGEKCKVAIRSSRHEARDIVDTLKKEREIGEDEATAAGKKIEAIIQDANTRTETIVGKKEKDIMEI